MQSVYGAGVSYDSTAPGRVIIVIIIIIVHLRMQPEGYGVAIYIFCRIFVSPGSLLSLSFWGVS